MFIAIGKYGRPRVIRTDNEAMFISPLWRTVLKLIGVRPQLTARGCPWMNGRVERFFGTLKAKLDHIEVASHDALRSCLGEFGLWYNHVRPHQNLAGVTPVEAWHGTDPYAQTPKQVLFFEAWEGLLTGYYMRR